VNLNNNLLKTSVLILTLIVLGKITGFLKDVVLTYYHGVSAITDAFFLSSSIATVIYMAVFLSIPVVLVPILMKSIQSSGSVYSHSAFRLLVVFAVISLVFSVGVWFGAEQLVGFFSGELGSVTTELATAYLSIMSVTFFLSTAVSFFNSVQISQKNTLPSYATPIVNNSIFILSIFIFSQYSEFHIVLMFGIFSWFLLLIANVRSVSGYFNRKYFNKDSLNGLIKSSFIMLPAILSIYIEQVNTTISIFFATEVGDGAVTTMFYGNKLNTLFLSVFIVILTTVIFPRIAEQISKNKVKELKNNLHMYLKVILLIGLPFAYLMSIFSEQFISLIFERGSFTKHDVVNVSAVFSVLIFGLIMSLIRDLVNRVYFAYKKTMHVFYITTFSVLINFILSLAWYQDFGLLGLSYASVASLVFNVLISLYFLSVLMKQPILILTIRIFLSLSFSVVLSYACFYFLSVVGVSVTWAFLISFFAYLGFIYINQFRGAWLELNFRNGKKRI